MATAHTCPKRNKRSPLISLIYRLKKIECKRFSYLAYPNGVATRFIFELPIFISSCTRDRTALPNPERKGEFFCPLTNQETKQIHNCRLVLLRRGTRGGHSTHGDDDRLEVLCLPYEYGNKRSLAYVLYRDEVMSGEIVLLSDRDADFHGVHVPL